MESLEEDLTCSVCYSLFTDPRVLPCSHTFCRSCLDNVLQVSTNISIWRPLRLPLKCPNCRSVMELPHNGVEALPVNVSLRAIIEKYQRDSPPRPPSCPDHPQQPLNVYCVQDCKLICGLCLTTGEHQGHTIDDLQAAYAKALDAPAKLVERLTDDHWEEMCSLVEELEREKSGYEDLIRQDREAATQFFQGLEHILSNKKKAFMKVLDQANEQLLSAYKPLIETLKDMKEEQLELISLISSVSEEESALVFLEKVHQLRDRVDALSQKSLPEVPALQFSPSIVEFLDEHWPKVTVERLDDGPVPVISCSLKESSGEEPRFTSRPKWRLHTWVYLVFLLAILLLLLFWLNPADGSVLEFALIRQLSFPVPHSGEFFFCSIQDLSHKVGLGVSALSESVYQYVALFLKALPLS